MKEKNKEQIKRKIEDKIRELESMLNQFPLAQITDERFYHPQLKKVLENIEEYKKEAESINLNIHNYETKIEEMFEYYIKHRREEIIKDHEAEIELFFGEFTDADFHKAYSTIKGDQNEK